MTDEKEENIQKMRVWGERFMILKNENGLTDNQLKSVFAMLSQARAFRFNHIEESAWRQLKVVLG